MSARTSIYKSDNDSALFLLDAIAVHRVANRPDRFEPRARKRRYKNYPFLMKSRQASKSDILETSKGSGPIVFGTPLGKIKGVRPLCLIHRGNGLLDVLEGASWIRD